MKSILSWTGVSPRGRYVRSTHFISLYPTQCKTHISLKNPREIFSPKTFVERTSMNERIQELAEQAQQYAEYTTPQGLEWFGTFKEKFAELIVREFVKHLKETKHVKVELPFLQSADIKTIEELPLSVYITDLLEHFGVKE